MASAIIDFVAHVDPSKRQALERNLAALQASLGLPPNAPFGQVRTLHFASFVVFDDDTRPALLVFENNYEGDLGNHLTVMLAQASPSLHQIFSCCGDYNFSGPVNARALADYLLGHAVYPAAYHIGNVGRSPQRVREELAFRKMLCDRLDARLHTGDYPRSRKEAYELLNHETDASGKLEWARSPHARQALAERIAPWARLIGIAVCLVSGLLLLLPITVVALLIFAAVLRTKERGDHQMRPTDLDPDHVRRLTTQEDNRVQNHLASITTVKPGVFRHTLLRVVLWGANLIARTSTHGSLSGIPSIHFAHWALIGDDRLLFLSNFDGSWESYLDDFIDKASIGLTGIWTNTVGFPRTRWLVLEGARDGVAFKAFARAQQTLTAVWYSAYPDLTVQQIDAHSTLREGLADRPRGAELDELLRCT